MSSSSQRPPAVPWGRPSSSCAFDFEEAAWRECLREIQDQEIVHQEHRATGGARQARAATCVAVQLSKNARFASIRDS